MNKILNWLQDNWLLVAVALVVIYLVVKKRENQENPARREG